MSRKGVPLRPVADRFMEKVDFYATPDDCWIWTASLRGNGYGQFYYRGKCIPAHRAAYRMFVGPIPDDLFVCHTCDIRMCVNPDHLWVGTLQDNAADMVAKGRQVKGRRVNSAALKPPDIVRIRHELADVLSHGEIALIYGVDRSTISSVIRCDTWKHLEAS